MKDWAGVVLAAGQGQRMKSSVPKVLHPVCGKPMIAYAVDALRGAGIDDVTLVVSASRAQSLSGLLGGSLRFVEQPRPLGTGQALLQCAPALRDAARHVVVMNSDSPLLRHETMRGLVSHHRQSGAAVTLLTSTGALQPDMGRVMRDAQGRVTGIVEASDINGHHDAREVNVGVYCFDAGWLWPNLSRLKKSPRGEYYLTDLISMAVKEGKTVESMVSKDPNEGMGVNDRVQLAQAEATLRRRICERWMREGVTIQDPATTYIDADAVIGQDTLILPNTIIQGATRIGKNCAIGPGSFIRASSIGDRCRVTASFIEESTLEPDVDVGPFSHLRQRTHVESHAHIGNFAEVKESRLKQGVKMGHFGYVGDASVGANTNLGAGLVTCNFDGVDKHRTEIGDNAFIGSDTMLVAPVKVGDGASTGAGSVVTKDVPNNRLAVGVPARILEKSP
jgi:bifunctional UDP-N-acetylglucosamine pyrophosphorylase/glucosamine-1-phosphate N-acetyltransferase